MSLFQSLKLITTVLKVTGLLGCLVSKYCDESVDCSQHLACEDITASTLLITDFTDFTQVYPVSDTLDGDDFHFAQLRATTALPAAVVLK